MTIRVSTFSLRIWMPFSACMARRRPSNVNGRVTTPMVSAPTPLAISAKTGAAPVPVPPPLPAVMNTMSAPCSASSMSARCSSAARRPTSGSLPAPEPAGQLPPDVELQVGVAHEQRLRVRVGGDELDVAQPGVDHAVDGVHSAAAHSNHLDDCQVVALGRHGRHDSPRLRVDRRPVARWYVPPTVTVDVREDHRSLNLWGRLMFTVRQRGPTIRGVFRQVKHPTPHGRDPTSRACHRRGVGNADVDDIPVVQGARQPESTRRPRILP